MYNPTIMGWHQRKVCQDFAQQRDSDMPTAGFEDIPGMAASMFLGFSMKGMASDICMVGPRATAAAT